VENLSVVEFCKTTMNELIQNHEVEQEPRAAKEPFSIEFPKFLRTFMIIATGSGILHPDELSQSLNPLYHRVCEALPWPVELS
jgi:hypothetical protein